MNVTVYTDASFDPDRRVGGWAAWVRSASGLIVRSGSTPDYLENSTEAEIAAAYAGIYLAATSWFDVEEILLCSDSTACVDRINRKESIKPPSAVVLRLLGNIDSVTQPKQIRVMARWVRGHSQDRTTKAFVNRACDTRAKAVLRKQTGKL